jgi:hypothetical protein
LACGEKCNAFFILAGSLADPEVFICNEYICKPSLFHTACHISQKVLP